MTAIAVHVPTRESARKGTDALKETIRKGETLWRQAYAEEWWRLLDYPSWNAYCTDELGVTTRQARYYVSQAKAEAIEGGNVSARKARRILAPVETVDADNTELHVPSNPPGAVDVAVPGSPSFVAYDMDGNLDDSLVTYAPTHDKACETGGEAPEQRVEGAPSVSAGPLAEARFRWYRGGVLDVQTAGEPTSRFWAEVERWAGSLVDVAPLPLCQGCTESGTACQGLCEAPDEYVSDRSVPFELNLTCRVCGSAAAHGELCDFCAEVNSPDDEDATGSPQDTPDDPPPTEEPPTERSLAVGRLIAAIDALPAKHRFRRVHRFADPAKWVGGLSDAQVAAALAELGEADAA